MKKSIKFMFMSLFLISVFSVNVFADEQYRTSLCWSNATTKVGSSTTVGTYDGESVRVNTTVYFFRGSHMDSKQSGKSGANYVSASYTSPTNYLVTKAEGSHYVGSNHYYSWYRKDY